MIETIDNSCNFVHYADDTVIFTSNKDVYDSLKALGEKYFLLNAISKVIYSQKMLAKPNLF